MKRRIAVLAGISAVVIIITSLTSGFSLSIPQSKSEAVKPLNIDVLLKDSSRLAPGGMTTLPLTVVINSDEQSIITLESTIVTNNGRPFEVAEGLSSVEDKAILKAGDGSTDVLLTIRADPTVKEGTYYLLLEATGEGGRSSAWTFPVEVTAQ